MLEYKTFKFGRKDATTPLAAAEGVFSGLASVYGNVDSYGDVVMPGAFSQWFSEEGPFCLVLPNHDMWIPIGKALLSDSPTGLVVEEGKLSMDLQDAKDMFVRVRDELVSGISIGYETRDSGRGPNGERQLTNIKLYEISLVTFPANDLARVNGVKSALVAQGFNLEKLAEIERELKAGRVLSQANMGLLQDAHDAMTSAVEKVKSLLAAAAKAPVATDEEAAKAALVEEVKSFESFGEALTAHRPFFIR